MRMFHPILAWIAVIISFILIISRLEIGFDLFDEGYYITCLQEDFNPTYSVSAWFYLVRKVFFFMDLNIINVRIIRLLTGLFSSLFFAFCFNYFLQRLWGPQPKYTFLLIIGLALFENAIGFAPYAYTLSFNNVAAVLCTLIAGLILTIVANRKLLKISSFVIGILVTGLILTKITVVFVIGLFGAAVFFFLLIWYRKYLFPYLSSILFVLLGCLVSILLTTLDSDFRLFFLHLGTSLDLASDGSHTIGNVFNLAFKDGKVFFGALLAAACAALTQSWIQKKINPYILNILFNFGFALIIHVVMIKLLINLNYSYLNSPFLFTTSYVIISLVANSSKKAIRSLIGILSLGLIILLPFALTLGTNTGFFYTANFFFIFWVIPKVLFSLEKTKAFSLSLLFPYFLFGIYFLNTHLVPEQSRSGIKYPQTEKVIAGNGYLYVDKERKKGWDELRNKLESHGFEQNDYIMDFYKLHGLTFLMGGTNPGGLLWEEHFLDIYFRNLETAKLDKSKNLFVFSREPLNEKIYSGMKDFGFQPDDIVLKDSINLVKQRNDDYFKVLIYKLEDTP